MFASVRRASPRSVLTTRERRSVRLSSMMDSATSARAADCKLTTPRRPPASRDESMILLHLAVAALYAIAAWVRWPRSGAPQGAAVAWLVPIALVLHAFVIA